MMATVAPVDRCFRFIDESFAASGSNERENSSSISSNVSSQSWVKSTNNNHFGSYSIQEDYDWKQSTEQNYRREIHNGDRIYFGEYSDFRKRLDPTYHTNYIPERQAFQDTIITSTLYSLESTTTTSKDCTASPSSTVPAEFTKHETPTEQAEGPQWILFTAGVYGAGKSHILQRLQSNDCFPSPREFVAVDPDDIRRKLPEFAGYAETSAGQHTQKEAGMIAEILTDVALSRGSNVLVDGSLKDAAWHEDYFATLRRKHLERQLRIGILYVTAPQNEIYERVQTRNRSSNRIIPMDKLEQSLKQVPASVERLKFHSDFFVKLFNSQHDQQEGRPLQLEWISTNHHGGGAEDTAKPVSAIEKRMRREQCTSLTEKS
jgi:predicted kinase